MMGWVISSDNRIYLDITSSSCLLCDTVIKIAPDTRVGTPCDWWGGGGKGKGGPREGEWDVRCASLQSHIDVND